MKFDQAKFIDDISTTVSARGMTVTDAVVHWCDKNNTEIEFVANVIKKIPGFMAKIENEANSNNMLKKKVNKLPGVL